jgi:hypothetical protein
MDGVWTPRKQANLGEFSAIQWLTGPKYSQFEVEPGDPFLARAHAGSSLL